MDAETQAKMNLVATIGIRCSQCWGEEYNTSIVCGNEHPARFKQPLPRGVCPRCNGWGWVSRDISIEKFPNINDPAPLYPEPFMNEHAKAQPFKPVTWSGDVTDFVESRFHF